MQQIAVFTNVMLGIFFLGLLSSRTATAQLQCSATAIPTLSKYNLLSLNMLEAQVATIMGGTGVEQYQLLAATVTQKSIQYSAPAVNYATQGSISLTYSNGRLTAKSVSNLCATSNGQCTSTVVATRANYNLLTMGMTEAQVTAAMGGAGIEQSQAGFTGSVSKSVRYNGATVNYLTPSIYLTFTNGLLTMKFHSNLC